MPKYQVVFYLDVRATCDVEADTPNEAYEKAITEDWEYTDEDMYEKRIYEYTPNGEDCFLVYPKPKEKVDVL